MSKGRTYIAGRESTGWAFSPLGCGAAPSLVNPNVTALAPPAGTAFTIGPGKTLTNIHVQLIFWGAWWNNNPLGGQLENAVKNLLAGPYMAYLAQYGVHRGTLKGSTYAGDSEPGSYSSISVRDFVLNLLDNDRLPEPRRGLADRVRRDNAAQLGIPGRKTTRHHAPTPGGHPSKVVGQNSQVKWYDYDIGDVDNDPAYFLWVGNDGTLDYITTVLSHELVELATDPNEGDGVTQIGPTTAVGSQIGDVGTVCQGWCDYVRGVKVQAYWSILDETGALPKMYSVRRTLFGKNIGGKLPRPMPSANAWITSQF